MHTQLTSPAQKALRLAGQEAQQLGHLWVDTDHILLGLFRVREESFATLDLQQLYPAAQSRVAGLTFEQRRSALGRTNRNSAKNKLLTVALGEAQRLRVGYIDLEHMLLAVMSNPEFTAYGVLVDLGFDFDAMRHASLELFARKLIVRFLRRQRLSQRLHETTHELWRDFTNARITDRRLASACLDDDLEFRELALRLRVIRPWTDNSIKVITDSLTHVDLRIRQLSKRLFVEIADQRGVGHLISLLGDPDEELRASAADALARIGDESAHEPLIELLSDNSSSVRKAVAGALESLGCCPKSIGSQIQLAIEQREFAKAIALGPDAIEPIVKLTARLDPKDKSHALAALKQVRDSQSIEVLFSGLGQWPAEKALTDIAFKDSKTFAKLLRWLRQNDDPTVANRICELCRYDAGDQAMELLIALIQQSDNARTVRNALSAFRFMPPGKKMKERNKLFEKLDSSVRDSTNADGNLVRDLVDTLLEMGDVPLEYLDVLVQVLPDLSLLSQTRITGMLCDKGDWRGFSPLCDSVVTSAWVRGMFVGPEDARPCQVVQISWAMERAITVLSRILEQAADIAETESLIQLRDLRIPSAYALNREKSSPYEDSPDLKVWRPSGDPRDTSRIAQLARKELVRRGFDSSNRPVQSAHTRSASSKSSWSESTHARVDEIQGSFQTRNQVDPTLPRHYVWNATVQLVKSVVCLILALVAFVAATVGTIGLLRIIQG